MTRDAQQALTQAGLSRRAFLEGCGAIIVVFTAAEGPGRQLRGAVSAQGRTAASTGQYDAAQAVATLRRLLVDERLLQRMRPLGTAEPLERGHTGPVHVPHLRDAGPDGTTIHEDRAAAALAEPAAEFRPAQSELFKQHVEQWHRRIEVHRMVDTVHREGQQGHSRISRMADARFDVVPIVSICVTISCRPSLLCRSAPVGTHSAGG